jgi:hypothetical protein
MPPGIMNPFGAGRAVPPGDPAALRGAAEAFSVAADALTGASASGQEAAGVAPGSWSGVAATRFGGGATSVQARAAHGAAALRTAAGALYVLAAELEEAIADAQRAESRAEQVAEETRRVQRDMDGARGAELAALDARAEALRARAREVEGATVAAFDRAAVAAELAAGVFDEIAAAAFANSEQAADGTQVPPGAAGIAGGGVPGGAGTGGLAGGGLAGGGPLVPGLGLGLPVPGLVVPGPGGRPLPLPGRGGAFAWAPGGRPAGAGMGWFLPGRTTRDGDPARSVHTVKEHVTSRDLTAARLELLGIPVARKLGGDPYDHVKEVRGAQRALLDRIKSIKKRMAHPGVPFREQGSLSAELGEASRLLDLTESFVPRPTR